MPLFTDGKKDDFKGPFFNPLTLGEREKLVRIGREATEMVYSSTVDTDVGKLETMLDHWCLELKRNVLVRCLITSQSK